jgi:formylglycine-generating enzyme required for sulfatase activity
MLPKQVSVVGIAWYERADYPRILEIMTDRDKLPPTFNKWEKLAEDTERTAKGRGITVVRAKIKPDEFVDWCAKNGLNVGAEGRTRYGALVARDHLIASEKR